MVAIDTFEDGGLAEYVGDTAYFAITTDSSGAFEGSNYLEHISDGEHLIVNNNVTLSYDDFPINFYVQVPSSGRIGFAVTATGNETTYDDFVGTYLKFYTDSMEIVTENSDGNTDTNTVSSTGNEDWNGTTGLSTNTWYRVRFLLGENQNRMNISIFETGNNPNTHLAHDSAWLFDNPPNKFAIYGQKPLGTN